MNLWKTVKNNAPDIIILIISIVIGLVVPALLQVNNILYNIILAVGSFVVGKISELLYNEFKKFVILYNIIGLSILITLCVLFWITPQCCEEYRECTKTSIIVTGGIFIIGLFFKLCNRHNELSSEHSNLLKLNTENYNLWKLKKEIKQQLAKLKSTFSVIADDTKNTNDLFIKHFTKEFEKLSESIELFNTDKELNVDYTYFLNSENINYVFPNGHGFWYYIWQFNDDKDLFMPDVWKLFFQKVFDLVKEGYIMTEIKAILVFPNKHFIKKPAISKILDFYNSNSNHSCKIMCSNEYSDIMRQEGENPYDFGIYGTNCLYIETKNPTELSGYFTRKQKKISDYTKFFNTLWQRASDNPSQFEGELTAITLTAFCNNSNGNDFTLPQKIFSDSKKIRSAHSNTNVPKGELITFVDTNDYFHNGILYRAENSDKTIIHIHGSFGNFYQNDFIQIMAELYTNAGYNFMSFNLRCHDGFGECYKKDGSFKYSGGAISDWNTCLDDIQGAINYANTFSQKIILQGHSLGCDRIVYYLMKNNNNFETILLAPCDSYKLHLKWLDNDEKKQQSEFNKQIHRLKSMHDLDFNWLPIDEYGLTSRVEDYILPITKKALLSIIDGPPFKLFNLSKPYAFKLSNRCFIYLGGNDNLQTSLSETMFNYFTERFKSVEKCFVNNGDHMMTGSEREVTQKIIDWLNQL
jgi:predicted esterase